MKPRIHFPVTSPRSAFTLVELLAVIAIIAILAAIIIPVTGKVRQSARASTATSNLRQLGLAANTYASEHRVFPDGVTAWWVNTWDGLLQPYVAAQGGGWGNASKVFEDPARVVEPTATGSDVQGTVMFSANQRVFRDVAGDSAAPTVRPVMIARPSETVFFITGAQMNDGKASVFARADSGAYDATAANGNTPMFATPAAEGRAWPGPEAPSYRHGGRALTVMADGSVKAFLPGEIRRKHFQIAY